MKGQFSLFKTLGAMADGSLEESRKDAMTTEVGTTTIDTCFASDTG